jgi:dTDP-4-dehydrorhamnose reductase
MIEIKKPITVLILGAKGQVGQALMASKPADFNIIALSRNEQDITNAPKLGQCLHALTPQIIINAAGFTQVELAEQEPELATLINGAAVSELARLAKQQGARLIHLSSDYVFDGNKKSPYLCTDSANPINHYGQSKRQGELEILAHNNNKLTIVRTSWLYGGQGQHFVDVMLNLMRTKETLSVVADQYGSPTYVLGLANFIWSLCHVGSFSPIYHWSDSGVCSWFEFAQEIQRQAILFGIIKQSIPIIPISTECYSSIVNRPAYSALACDDSINICLAKPWQTQLTQYLLNTRKS